MGDIGKKKKRISVPAPSKEPAREPAPEPQRKEKERELVPARGVRND
jgi:hypothetical protein